MNQVRANAIAQLEGYELPLFKAPLLVVVHYHIPVSARSCIAIRKHKHLMPHAIRPDGDNLDKFLNDALNGVIWQDDSQIVWLLRSKSFTQEKVGKTVLYVKEIENMPPDYETLLEEMKEHIEVDFEM